MTQKERLLDYLNRHGTITAREAVYKLGITQLSARIIDLERDGWTVPRKRVFVANWNGKKVRVTQYQTPQARLAA